MKMIYQQMLAFFAVIVITILLLGFSFARMTRSFVYDSTWQRLENYSDSLIQQSLIVNNHNGNNVSFNVKTLTTSDALLKNQAVYFTVFNKKNQVIYPNDGLSPRVNKTDWQHLTGGEIVRKVSNKTKLSNGQVRPAMIEVLKPYYYRNKLVAVLITGAFVSSINSNINTINQNLLHGFWVALILALMISFIIAARLNRRISELRSAATQVANGNYNIRVKDKGTDEMGQLISDFNNMTESLEKSQEEIARQEERRQEFLANAAHEMRTPLTTISGILEGFKYGVIQGSDREKSINLMDSETQRLIRLVNENLDYEKIRSNSIQLHETQFNATKVMNTIVEQLKNKARDSGDNMTVRAPKELPVYADYDRFVQIVFNITNNAIQFTDKGQITLIGERGYNETIIRVADTGIGMTPDQEQNIFERYYKADASRRSGKYGESGLGLAIVHQLVKQHHGEISVASELHKGTTFTVIFPDKGTNLKDKPKPGQPDDSQKPNPEQNA